VRRAIEAWWLAGDFKADRATALAELKVVVESHDLNRLP
jgi:hypothetical protein